MFVAVVLFFVFRIRTESFEDLFGKPYLFVTFDGNPRFSPTNSLQITVYGLVLERKLHVKCVFVASE